MSRYRFQYFVEGDTEKKIIEEFKKEQSLIVSGTVNKFNVIEKIIPNAAITNLRSNTIAILVFDTDKKVVSILQENIIRLKRCKNIKEIWCVMQVDNLEDELIRATDVKQIKDLIGCRSNKDFKRDFLREKRLMIKLRNHHFQIDKMWVTDPSEEYKMFQNDGKRIIRHKRRKNEPTV